MNDLEYIDHGMFTSFIPVSKAGDVAFNQMAAHTEGTGKVLSIHKQSTIQQLRQADDMLRELGIE